ncbi:helix-turn-helix domain-containing protein [Acidobacteriota bacterium]
MSEKNLEEESMKKEILLAFKKLNRNSSLYSKKRKRSTCEDIINLLVEYYCVDYELPLNEILNHVEKAAILVALTRFNGSQREAAHSLGIKHTTLFEKMRRYNICLKKKISVDFNLDENVPH